MLETMTPPIPASTGVLIVGAGPVGLALAGDLGSRGVECLLDRAVATARSTSRAWTWSACAPWNSAGAGASPTRCAMRPIRATSRRTTSTCTSMTGYEFGRERFPSRARRAAGAESPQKRERVARKTCSTRSCCDFARRSRRRRDDPSSVAGWSSSSEMADKVLATVERCRERRPAGGRGRTISSAATAARSRGAQPARHRHGRPAGADLHHQHHFPRAAVEVAARQGRSPTASSSSTSAACGAPSSRSTAATATACRSSARPPRGYVRRARSATPSGGSSASISTSRSSRSCRGCGANWSPTATAGRASSSPAMRRT